MRNNSNENEFDLRENGPVGETHFHMNGFARRLVLRQRQRVTRKWSKHNPEIDLFNKKLCQSGISFVVFICDFGNFTCASL